jgi:D-alanyl-lipoteichoic acid acyltransferase DltB (MBOAT superfamily)
MKNFNLPYFSCDISEFWRRWHISLNKWFIDYVYIPLGGSRVSKLISIRNILIVFLLSGLWHGANWTFVAWGAYNGILIALLILLGKNKKRENIISPNKFIPSLKEIGEITLTFILVVFGWILFRAESISMAYDYVVNMLNSSIFAIPNFRDTEIGLIKLTYTIGFIIILQIIDWIQRKQDFGLEISNIKYRPIRWSIYLFIILIFTIFAGGQETFIYFQF